VIAAALQHSIAILRARHTGAARRLAMEIVGLVMLGSIVLYLLLQVDDLTA
jgi:hypothetical protein